MDAISIKLLVRYIGCGEKEGEIERRERDREESGDR